MNHSGDAAEQIVRMSLEGVEVAAKITGAAAKELAVFLLAALKSPGKTGKGLKLKGKARLTSMLKSGKSLEIFSVKERDLKDFMRGAKQYGVLYCVLRNRKNNPDGLCDIMVRADDAPKINRIIERYKFATVERARVENEAAPDNDAPTLAPESPESDVPEHAEPEMNGLEAMLNSFLSAEEERDTPQESALEVAPETNDAPEVGEFDFFTDETANDRQSEFSSENKRTSEKDTFDSPSQTEPIREIGAEHIAAPEPETVLQRPVFDFDLVFGKPSDEPYAAIKPATATEKESSGRPSVKEQLREIKAARKLEEEKAAPQLDGITGPDKSKPNPATVHQQPQGGGQRKSVKIKERF